MDMDGDLDHLVGELNASTENQAASTEPLLELLRQMVIQKASDLFLVPGAQPAVRRAGAVQTVGGNILDDNDVEAIVLPALPAHAYRQWRTAHLADCSVRVAGVGRFRINLHRERGRPAAAIRLLPVAIPSIATLKLPPSIEMLTRLGPGLVLLGGATGSGKTTTLATLV